jgi:hypothetical protein
MIHEDKDALLRSEKSVETGIGRLGGGHGVVPCKTTMLGCAIGARGALAVCPRFAVVLTALAGVAISRLGAVLERVLINPVL